MTFIIEIFDNSGTLIFAVIYMLVVILIIISFKNEQLPLKIVCPIYILWSYLVHKNIDLISRLQESNNSLNHD